MNKQVSRNPNQLVQIVGPNDDWILERLAKCLARKLPYATLATQPTKRQPEGLVYYINYALYNGPSGSFDVGLFPHCENPEDFLGRARRMDYCVSMSKLYTDWLIGQGVKTVCHIPMGYDVYRYRPRLVLGVVGLLEHPREGRHLVEELRRLPFVEIITTEGKVPEHELREVYQRLDYVLILATIEGGPMSLLEGLAMGKPVMAPEGVGLVPEFAGTEHVRTYPAGDAQALVKLVTTCYDC
jgi:glycosyltransferase involved in cell wall biosynthesis